jgi:hypothetical protein
MKIHGCMAVLAAFKELGSQQMHKKEQALQCFCDVFPKSHSWFQTHLTRLRL